MCFKEKGSSNIIFAPSIQVPENVQQGAAAPSDQPTIDISQDVQIILSPTASETSVRTGDDAAGAGRRRRALLKAGYYDVTIIQDDGTVIKLQCPACPCSPAATTGPATAPPAAAAASAPAAPAAAGPIQGGYDDYYDYGYYGYGYGKRVAVEWNKGRFGSGAFFANFGNFGK